MQGDVTKEIDYGSHIDYIFHCANNTSSKSFVETPVETMDVAFNGTRNVLEFAKRKKIKSMVHLSSIEVYGKVEQTDKLLKEEDLGYLDLYNVRNSYPIAKRAAEALCKAYATEKKVPVKIARLAQIVGSNIDYDDSRVLAYFAKNAVERKDIVLKTRGNDIRSYCYITDVITALITMLHKGQDGSTYNVANEQATCSLKQIAEKISNKFNETNVFYDIDNKNLYPEKANWAMETSKLQSLGWQPTVNRDQMFDRLIQSFYRQTNAINEPPRKQIKWYQKIFAIGNKGQYKVVRFFGFTYKIDRSNIFEKKYAKLPINKNKIVFSNFYGNGYACNPKYIAEEILKRKLPYELVWLVKDLQNNSIPERIKKVHVKYALRELATAKTIISNVRLNPYIKKGFHIKHKQHIIQVWHGSLGIKRIANAVSANHTEGNVFQFFAVKDSLMTSLCVSNSTFETNVFKNDFWYDGEIAMLGHPRNDIFFYDDDRKAEIKNKVFESLNIDSDCKVVLYVPSFRDDRRLTCYNLNTDKLIDALEDKFGGKWIVAIRMHPHIQKFSNLLFKMGERVIDATFYPDIQELLISADAAITDYSSCIFDFLFTKRPGFIFATDIDTFDQERGFYYPLSETPFPVATNNDEICNNIQNFELEPYQQKVDEFIKGKGCIDDGHASERVVDSIEKTMKEERSE